MRGQQQDDGAVDAIQGQFIETLLDEQFPVAAGMQALLIEPDLMAARSQVVAQSGCH
jgi:hypothetical protein